MEVEIGSRGVALDAAPDTESFSGQPPALGPDEICDIAIDVVVGGGLIEIGHLVKQHRVEDGTEQLLLWCIPTAFDPPFALCFRSCSRSFSVHLALASARSAFIFRCWARTSANHRRWASIFSESSTATGVSGSTVPFGTPASESPTVAVDLDAGCSFPSAPVIVSGNESGQPRRVRAEPCPGSTPGQSRCP